ncbi:TolC family protein [Zhongshania sp. BJYM1]|uniref:TolC family protein n=1 Tax=Zhongshania aquatica TaxID=2965069 RepID=UPI0022B565C2|nr:TolC family protein [Marortus sp. BJYM1]
MANTLAQHPQLHQFEFKEQLLLGRRESYQLKPSVIVGLEVENFAGNHDFSGIQTAEISLALSSVIELGGKRRSRVALADARIQELEYARQVSTIDILGQLTASYIETIEFQERISLAREDRDLAKKILSIVKHRSAKGATPESDLLRATAALAKADLILNALQQGHQRRVIKLAAYWGDTSPSWKQVEGDLYRFAQAAEFDELYRRALSSPALAVLASEKRLKRAELDLAKTNSRADLSWQLGVRHFEGSGDTALIAGMSLPLFSGNRNSGALRSARAAHNEVELLHQDAKLKLHVQLFEAYSQWQQHSQAVTTYRETIIPDLIKALNLTQKAYEAGRYSYQDWSSAQKELLDAKRALIDNAVAASLNQAVIEQLIAEPLNQLRRINQ